MKTAKLITTDLITGEVTISYQDYEERIITDDGKIRGMAGYVEDTYRDFEDFRDTQQY